MRQTAPDSAGPLRHDVTRLTVGPLCLPAIDMRPGDQGGTIQPAAPPPRTPRGAAHHPLEPLAARVEWLLQGCAVSLIPGADGPAMLMVERMAADGTTASHTWLLTPLSPTTLELEAIVGETRLDLVAEGPPDRLLAWLWRLNLRAARAVARRGG